MLYLLGDIQDLKDDGYVIQRESEAKGWFIIFNNMKN